MDAIFDTLKHSVVYLLPLFAFTFAAAPKFGPNEGKFVVKTSVTVVNTKTQTFRYLTVNRSEVRNPSKWKILFQNVTVLNKSLDDQDDSGDEDIGWTTPRPVSRPQVPVVGKAGAHGGVVNLTIDKPKASTEVFSAAGNSSGAAERLSSPVRNETKSPNGTSSASNIFPNGTSGRSASEQNKNASRIDGQGVKPGRFTNSTDASQSPTNISGEVNANKTQSSDAMKASSEQHHNVKGAGAVFANESVTNSPREMTTVNALLKGNTIIEASGKGGPVQPPVGSGTTGKDTNPASAVVNGAKRKGMNSVQGKNVQDKAKENQVAKISKLNMSKSPDSRKHTGNEIRATASMKNGSTPLNSSDVNGRNTGLIASEIPTSTSRADGRAVKIPTGSLHTNVSVENSTKNELSMPLPGGARTNMTAGRTGASMASPVIMYPEDNSSLKNQASIRAGIAYVPFYLSTQTPLQTLTEHPTTQTPLQPTTQTTLQPTTQTPLHPNTRMSLHPSTQIPPHPSIQIPSYQSKIIPSRSSIKTLSHPSTQTRSDLSTKVPSHSSIKILSHPPTKIPLHPSTKFLSHPSPKSLSQPSTLIPSHPSSQILLHTSTQVPLHPSTQIPLSQPTQFPLHPSTQIDLKMIFSRNENMTNATAVSVNLVHGSSGHANKPSNSSHADGKNTGNNLNVNNTMKPSPRNSISSPEVSLNEKNLPIIQSSEPPLTTNVSKDSSKAMTTTRPNHIQLQAPKQLPPKPAEPKGKNLPLPKPKVSSTKPTNPPAAAHDSKNKTEMPKSGRVMVLVNQKESANSSSPIKLANSSQLVGLNTSRSSGVINGSLLQFDAGNNGLISPTSAPRSAANATDITKHLNSALTATGSSTEKVPINSSVNSPQSNISQAISYLASNSTSAGDFNQSQPIQPLNSAGNPSPLPSTTTSSNQAVISTKSSENSQPVSNSSIGGSGSLIITVTAKPTAQVIKGKDAKSTNGKSPSTIKTPPPKAVTTSLSKAVSIKQKESKQENPSAQITKAENAKSTNGKGPNTIKDPPPKASTLISSKAVYKKTGESRASLSNNTRRPDILQNYDTYKNNTFQNITVQTTPSNLMESQGLTVNVLNSTMRPSTFPSTTTRNEQAVIKNSNSLQKQNISKNDTSNNQTAQAIPNNPTQIQGVMPSTLNSTAPPLLLPGITIHIDQPVMNNSKGSGNAKYLSNSSIGGARTPVITATAKPSVQVTKGKDGKSINQKIPSTIKSPPTKAATAILGKGIDKKSDVGRSSVSNSTKKPEALQKHDTQKNYTLDPQTIPNNLMESLGVLSKSLDSPAYPSPLPSTTTSSNQAVISTKSSENGKQAPNSSISGSGSPIVKVTAKPTAQAIKGKDAKSTNGKSPSTIKNPPPKAATTSLSKAVNRKPDESKPSISNITKGPLQKQDTQNNETFPNQTTDATPSNLTVSQGVMPSSLNSSWRPPPLPNTTTHCDKPDINNTRSSENDEQAGNSSLGSRGSPVITATAKPSAQVTKGKDGKSINGKFQSTIKTPLPKFSTTISSKAINKKPDERKASSSNNTKRPETLRHQESLKNDTLHNHTAQTTPSNVPEIRVVMPHLNTTARPSTFPSTTPNYQPAITNTSGLASGKHASNSILSNGNQNITARPSAQVTKLKDGKSTNGKSLHTMKTPPPMGKTAILSKAVDKKQDESKASISNIAKGPGVLQKQDTLKTDTFHNQTLQTKSSNVTESQGAMPNLLNSTAGPSTLPSTTIYNNQPEIKTTIGTEVQFSLGILRTIPPANLKTNISAPQGGNSSAKNFNNSSFVRNNATTGGISQTTFKYVSSTENSTLRIDLNNTNLESHSGKSTGNISGNRNNTGNGHSGIKDKNAILPQGKNVQQNSGKHEVKAKIGSATDKKLIQANKTAARNSQVFATLTPVSYSASTNGSIANTTLGTVKIIAGNTSVQLSHSNSSLLHRTTSIPVSATNQDGTRKEARTYFSTTPLPADQYNFMERLTTHLYAGHATNVNKSSTTLPTTYKPVKPTPNDPKKSKGIATNTSITQKPPHIPPQNLTTIAKMLSTTAPTIVEMQSPSSPIIIFFDFMSWPYPHQAPTIVKIPSSTAPSVVAPAVGKKLTTIHSNNERSKSINSIAPVTPPILGSGNNNNGQVTSSGTIKPTPVVSIFSSHQVTSSATIRPRPTPLFSIFSSDQVTSSGIIRPTPLISKFTTTRPTPLVSISRTIRPTPLISIFTIPSVYKNLNSEENDLIGEKRNGKAPDGTGIEAITKSVTLPKSMNDATTSERTQRGSSNGVDEKNLQRKGSSKNNAATTENGSNLTIPPAYKNRNSEENDVIGEKRNGARTKDPEGRGITAIPKSVKLPKFMKNTTSERTQTGSSNDDKKLQRKGSSNNNAAGSTTEKGWSTFFKTIPIPTTTPSPVVEDRNNKYVSFVGNTENEIPGPGVDEMNKKHGTEDNPKLGVHDFHKNLHHHHKDTTDHPNGENWKLEPKDSGYAIKGRHLAKAPQDTDNYKQHANDIENDVLNVDKPSAEKLVADGLVDKAFSGGGDERNLTEYDGIVPSMAYFSTTINPRHVAAKLALRIRRVESDLNRTAALLSKLKKSIAKNHNGKAHRDKIAHKLNNVTTFTKPDQWGRAINAVTPSMSTTKPPKVHSHHHHHRHHHQKKQKHQPHYGRHAQNLPVVDPGGDSDEEETGGERVDSTGSVTVDHQTENDSSKSSPKAMPGLGRAAVGRKPETLKEQPAVEDPEGNNNLNKKKCLSVKEFNAIVKNTIKPALEEKLNGVACPPKMPCQVWGSCTQLWKTGLIKEDLSIDEEWEMEYFELFVSKLLPDVKEEIRSFQMRCYDYYALREPFGKKLRKKRADQKETTEAPDAIPVDHTGLTDCRARILDLQECLGYATWKALCKRE